MTNIITTGTVRFIRDLVSNLSKFIIGKDTFFILNALFGTFNRYYQNFYQLIRQIKLFMS